MLTPAFELEQNPDFLLLSIKAPYVKANEVEIYIEGNEFKFYVKPYFLRLTFPCEIIEDGREKAEYDISGGIFKIQLPKKIQNEMFPNLDMLTTLLAPKKKTNTKPLIELAEAATLLDELSDKQSEDEPEDDDDNWEMEQELYQPPPASLSGYKYGFGNHFSGVFSRMQDELHEVIDLLDPENTSPQDRTLQRIEAEKQKFDAEHYLADFFDDEMIRELIKYKAPWDVEYTRILNDYKSSSYPETSELITPKGNTSLFSEETRIIFTDEERNMLLQLPNKEYILTKDEEHSIFLGLVDIIFAYAYNHRTTEGENTSESAWTVCKISSTLSWLDNFKSLCHVVKSNMQRCLCYPLYRHWLLTKAIFKDVQTLFVLGKRWLLRCLLEIRSILQTDENRYILNDLYITDYCVWLQKAKTRKILSLANKLLILDLTKDDMNIDLKRIEDKASSEYRRQHVDSGSGSETDSSESTDNSEESSLDSDDESSPSQSKYTVADNMDTPVCSQVKIETLSVQENTDKEVEAVRTGLEELLKIESEYVTETDDV